MGRLEIPQRSRLLPQPLSVLSLVRQGSAPTRFRTFQVCPKDPRACLWQAERAVVRPLGESRMVDLRRRDFITLIGGAAATWPLATRAQQPDRMRRIGVLIGSEDHADARKLLAQFQQALEQLGWVYGRNVQLDVRWGSDQERRVSYAKELVRLNPDVIFAGPSNAVLALQRETRSIPIVFVRVSDPIGQGVVESLARPNGNITGFSNPDFPFLDKWLQILKDIVPSVTRVGLMISTVNAASPHWYRLLDDLAPSVGITPVAIPIREVAEIEQAFQSLTREPNSGLIVPGDTLIDAPPVRALIIRLAASHRLPVVYSRRAYVADGGLVSYGIEPEELFQHAASYVDRILKGEKPSDLPVQQPTKYEFVINLKTARTFGFSVPMALLASADEVIE
jgi:putative tryptophan/tyrosine transport system substrate-binding protein